MTIEILRSEIERIIGELPGPPLYVRSTTSEANNRLNELQLDQPVCIHTDQTTITTLPSETGNRVTKVIPLELFIVIQETESDNPLTETDVLVTQCEMLADNIYDYLIQSDIIDELVPLSDWDFEIERAEAYKLWNSRMSGVRMTASVPVRRNVYYCPS